MLQDQSCKLIYNERREKLDEERSWWMKKLRKEENMKEKSWGRKKFCKKVVEDEEVVKEGKKV